MKYLAQAIRDGVAELYPGRGITVEAVSLERASLRLPWLTAMYFGLFLPEDMADRDKAAGLFSNFAGRPVTVAEAGPCDDGTTVFVITEGRGAQ